MTAPTSRPHADAPVAVGVVIGALVSHEDYRVDWSTDPGGRSIYVAICDCGAASSVLPTPHAPRSEAARDWHRTHLATAVLEALTPEVER